MTLSELRSLMPVATNWAYFDHAAVAPLPEPTRRAMAEQVADVAANGDVNWLRWRKNVERVRDLGATLIGADRDEIAVVRNTTEGIGLVAEGFPWQPGDNVVVPSGEFPSNLLPWKHLASRGVEVRVVETVDERLDLAALNAACDARTRIVTASWVGYATGYRSDPAALAAIAHRHGAYFFLDAIQGLGAFNLDVSCGIDFLAADGHKWLLGPEGAGLFYVRRELLNLLRPLLIGWNSVATAGDFGAADGRLKDSAARYEGGTYNMAGIAGLAESLELLTRVGRSLAGHLLETTELLCEQLRSAGAKIASDRGAGQASGIVAFTVPGRAPAEVRDHLLQAGVVVRDRGGGIRASPHGYTNAAEIDALAAAVRELV